MEDSNRGCVELYDLINVVILILMEDSNRGSSW